MSVHLFPNFRRIDKSSIEPDLTWLALEPSLINTISYMLPKRTALVFWSFLSEAPNSQFVLKLRLTASG